MRKILTIAWQVLLLSLIAYGMDKLVTWLHLPIPGSILGIIFVFLLLKFKILRLNWIEHGANWLIAEMLLFFIPIIVGIIQFKGTLIDDGLKLLLVVLVSTVLVMACSGIIAQQIARLKEHKQS